MATGTVKKRGKAWQIDISLGYIDGKQKRKRWTSKATTKAEATAEMNDELYKLNRQTRTGEAVDNDYRLSDLFESWKDHIQTNIVNPNTRRDYIYYIEHAMNVLPDNIAEINLRSVDDMMLEITQDKGLSHNLANKILARLKSMLNYGVSRGVLSSNPIKEAKPLPKKPVKHRRALTKEEVQTLLDTAPPKWSTIWRLILSTGLRKQEFLNLRWNNIDLDKRIMRVLPTDKWSPKTSTSIRTIPLTDNVVKDLKKIKKQAESINNYVFTTDTGKQLNHLLRTLKTHLHNMFCAIHEIPYGKRLNKKEQQLYNKHSLEIEAEMKRIDLHALRYTFCTQLIGAGVDLKTVQRLMGHSSPEVTLKIYAQYCHGNAESAIDNIPW